MKSLNLMIGLALAEIVLVGCGGGAPCSDLDPSCKRTAKASLSVVDDKSSVVVGEVFEIDASGSICDEMVYRANGTEVSGCRDEEICSVSIPTAGSYEIKLTCKVGKTGEVFLGLAGNKATVDEDSVTMTVVAATVATAAAATTTTTVTTATDSCSGKSVGDNCGGGILFATNYNGAILVAASSDQPIDLQWDTVNGIQTSTSDVNDGRNNSGSFSYPASLACQDLVSGGYSDWYLPAREEIKALCQQTTAFSFISGKISGLTGSYWSSSQVNDGSNDSTSAWIMNFAAGSCVSNMMTTKISTGKKTRCVRRP